jgi:hypothetical protein
MSRFLSSSLSVTTVITNGLEEAANKEKPMNTQT